MIDRELHEFMASLPIDCTLEQMDIIRSALLDASRYRWLRDCCTDSDISAGLGWIGQSVGIDAAIDDELRRL